MIYNKGIKGPESTNDVEIDYIKTDGTPANPMTKGIAMVTTRNGPRAVSFIAQGKNARNLKEAHDASGSNLRLKMRWTGRDAVTITGVVAQRPADIAA